MTFARSSLFIACMLAAGFSLTACSNSNQNDKKSDTLTASAPATGEASTVSERNAQQRLISTLEGHFKRLVLRQKSPVLKPLKYLICSGLAWKACRLSMRLVMVNTSFKVM